MRGSFQIQSHLQLFCFDIFRANVEGVADCGVCIRHFEGQLQLAAGDFRYIQQVVD